jgi:hypothetical protein
MCQHTYSTSVKQWQVHGITSAAHHAVTLEHPMTCSRWHVQGTTTKCSSARTCAQNLDFFTLALTSCHHRWH